MDTFFPGRAPYPDRPIITIFVQENSDYEGTFIDELVELLPATYRIGDRGSENARVRKRTLNFRYPIISPSLNSASSSPKHETISSHPCVLRKDEEIAKINLLNRPVQQHR